MNQPNKKHHKPGKPFTKQKIIAGTKNTSVYKQLKTIPVAVNKNMTKPKIILFLRILKLVQKGIDKPLIPLAVVL